MPGHFDHDLFIFLRIDQYNTYFITMSATKGKVRLQLEKRGPTCDADHGQTVLALTRVWHQTSAQDRVLGNLASRIAWVLMGKHKPTYDPAGEMILKQIGKVSDVVQLTLGTT